MTDHFINTCWADAFVMHFTADWPQPNTDEGVRALCELRLDMTNVLAAKLNGEPIPANGKKENYERAYR